MKTKINPGQAEQDTQNHSTEQPLNENQLLLNENNLLKEMQSLKQNEYYRLQIISYLARISESLENISKDTQ